MTFDTILIPTDGSEPAERAARRGFDLAWDLDAAVHVLSVADRRIAASASYSGDSHSIRERLLAKATERATAICEEATGRGLEATAATRDGIPAGEIVAYADEHDADAIVLGTSGRGGVARSMVGSVADKVVRTATVPVVTMTPEAADPDRAGSPIDALLLPTDGSEPAVAAARYGLDLAERLDATVHLLSVAESKHRGVLSRLGLGDDLATEDEEVKRVTDHLSSLVTEARDRKLDVVTATSVGDPAKEIVAYAEGERIDLIAMGTAGAGGFQRFVVGSVTDEVVRTSPVPVLTARPTDLGRQ